jgi:polyhydroxyalkanoate synthesis regulator protein
MFSTDMLANIIRYYGHAMQGLMGSYLERSIITFHEAQKRFQAQASSIYGELPRMPAEAWTQFMQQGQQIPNVMGGYLEKGAKAVIDMQEELRNQALKLFSGFPYAPPEDAPAAEAAKPRAKAGHKPATKKPRKPK